MQPISGQQTVMRASWPTAALAENALLCNFSCSRKPNGVPEIGKGWLCRAGRFIGKWYAVAAKKPHLCKST